MKNLTQIITIIITLIFFSGCDQQKDYSKEIDPIVNKYVEVWNGANVDELDAVIDSNFVRHAESTSTKGLDNLKKLITGTRTAFPDLQLLILQMEKQLKNGSVMIISHLWSSLGLQ
ncbi:MAG: ester cyclase [Ignavibacteriaceae bacterium]